MSVLKDLAIRYGSDKFGEHNYTGIYEKLFSDRRTKEISLLEIGIGGYNFRHEGGASLAMWRDFFERAHIVGVDFFEKDLDLGPRVTCLRGDQANPKFLNKLKSEYGPFDIIIDDGSHLNSDVIFTFEQLFEALNDGGIYVIEDTQTSFFEEYGGGSEQNYATILGYFANIWMQVDHAEIKARHQNVCISAMAEKIVCIERYHNLIVIHKGANDYPSNHAFNVACTEKIDDVISQLLMNRGLWSLNRLSTLFDFLVRAGRFDRAASVLCSLRRLYPEPESLKDKEDRIANAFNNERYF